MKKSLVASVLVFGSVISASIPCSAQVLTSSKNTTGIQAAKCIPQFDFNKGEIRKDVVGNALFYVLSEPTSEVFFATKLKINNKWVCTTIYTVENPIHLMKDSNSFTTYFKKLNSISSDYISSVWSDNSYQYRAVKRTRETGEKFWNIEIFPNTKNINQTTLNNKGFVVEKEGITYVDDAYTLTYQNNNMEIIFNKAIDLTQQDEVIRTITKFNKIMGKKLPTNINFRLISKTHSSIKTRNYDVKYSDVEDIVIVNLYNK